MRLDPEVTHNYAQALFNVAKKSGVSLDEIRLEADGFRQLLIEHPHYQVFLEGPQFREETKEEVVGKALKDKISELLYRMVIQLLRHNRIAYLVEILERFSTLILKDQGVLPCVVTTAIPLTEEEQQNMREKLEIYCKQKFDMRYRVDKNLIGGVKVQYADQLIDTSLQTYLIQLRSQLVQTRLAS